MKTMYQVFYNDGEVVCQLSELYVSREDAVKGIERHKRVYNWVVEYYICKVEAEVYWSK